MPGDQTHKTSRGGLNAEPPIPEGREHPQTPPSASSGQAKGGLRFK